jgi:hypothetical protein
MTEHTIAESERQEYFKQLTQASHGQEVELEIMGLDIGDQIEKDWVEFEGLTYDPELKVLHLYTASLEHQILNPGEIIAAKENDVLKSLLVKDSSGHSQILQFRNVQLPAEH